MRYWDSSALVPLVVEEQSSQRCRHLLRTDTTIITWVLSRIEITSALCRQQRAELLSRAELNQALRRTELLSEHWTEIDALTVVRARAERLLRVHSLRAADALQLGAALIAVDDRPTRIPFVALDDRLLEAAEREGFTTIVPRV